MKHSQARKAQRMGWRESCLQTTGKKPHQNASQVQSFLYMYNTRMVYGGRENTSRLHRFALLTRSTHTLLIFSCLILNLFNHLPNVACSRSLITTGKMQPALEHRTQNTEHKIQNTRSLEAWSQNVEQELFVSVIQSKLNKNTLLQLELKCTAAWTVSSLRKA